MTRVDEPLLEVTGLVKHYAAGGGLLKRRSDAKVQAVDDVSLTLKAGETLGLVGESGCGKSTLARTLLRLEEPTAGVASYRGQDIFGLSKAELRALRRRIQVVFQDPYAAFNPRLNIGAIIAEPWQIHPEVLARKRWTARVEQLLQQVGLQTDFARRYPHQLSGGQRQRVGIARALALEPEILICDEPVSALDVSVQAQVINLLKELRDNLGLAYLFIAHDLAVVRHLSHRVAVMYLGRIVEQGPSEAIFSAPAHPYTRALLSASPVPDPHSKTKHGRIRLQGELPDPADPPSGCRFRTRCWKATTECATTAPLLTASATNNHLVACHYPE